MASALDSGLGNMHINILMTAVEVPSMYSNIYKCHEKEIGAAVETTLKNEKEVVKLL